MPSRSSQSKDPPQLMYSFPGTGRQKPMNLYVYEVWEEFGIPIGTPVAQGDHANFMQLLLWLAFEPMTLVLHNKNANH